jgi:hypothetical protein
MGLLVNKQTKCLHYLSEDKQKCPPGALFLMLDPCFLQQDNAYSGPNTPKQESFILFKINNLLAFYAICSYIN